MKTNRIIKMVILMIVFISIITGCFNLKSKTKLEETGSLKEYQIVMNGGDLANTTITYNFYVYEKSIKVKYKNEFGTPELADGKLPAAEGEFNINDEYFVKPAKKIIEMWKTNHDEYDYSIDAYASLIFDALEDAENRNDNLCEVYGSWYCDLNIEIMDYNKDNKVTLEENFKYYVNQIDPSFLSDN